MTKGLIDRINYAERKRAQQLTQKSPNTQRQERLDAYVHAVIRLVTISTKE